MSDAAGPEPPLGAVPGAGGTRFSLLSSIAEAVELCLFDNPDAAAESRRVELTRLPGGLWTTEVASVGPGQLYGYRVHGPYEPRRGLRCNPHKLLIDPWARALTGEPRLDPALHGWSGDDSGEVASISDSAAVMPRSIVVADPGGSRRPSRPRTSWRDTVIYECHVKGMTQLHPEVPKELRGTYLGLAQPAVVDHLRALGVTAVELLPVQQFTSEPTLLQSGLSNYFGYNPLALFAPHAGWATGADGRQVEEFRRMVDALHEAGIEVLLDVVFNHTAEGGRDGTTLSWRGIDNAAYYRLDPEDPSRYVNWSGCGNTLDAAGDPGRRLVLDCLRYWVEALGVDGFRFDLAPSLGRDAEGRFAPDGGALAAIAADPVLADVKLIGEPWDLGPGGYRLGRLPRPWREWNDRFRDALRSYWRGDRGRKADLAAALGGSAALFDAARPRPVSVDFVTSHDGFTLSDLVSYERKHNEANLEQNRDGHNGNYSRNWGTEGPTKSPAVRQLRDRARRGLVASLALTAGVPMLSHGDEVGRSQRGNNNAYCHDSPLTWIDWSAAPDNEDFHAFCRRLFALRREHGLGVGATRRWLGADGRPLSAAGWRTGAGAPLGLLLSADAGEPGELRGGELLALLNGGWTEVLFQLPEPAPGRRWRRRLSTAAPEERPRLWRRGALRLLAHTLVLLDQVAPPSPAPDSSRNS